ncbi:MAG: hypothetical protein GY842_03755 [bacterium]|nr:hypothetical protein [bacterium]
MTDTRLQPSPQRTLCPAPWSEGDNITWNDPEFSERMLIEHLTQDQ